MVRDVRRGTRGTGRGDRTTLASAHPHHQTAEAPHHQTAEAPHHQTAEAPHHQTAEAPHHQTAGEAPHHQTAGEAHTTRRRGPDRTGPQSGPASPEAPQAQRQASTALQPAQPWRRPEPAVASYWTNVFGPAAATASVPLTFG